MWLLIRFHLCKEIKSGFSSLLCFNEVATVPVLACSILLSLQIDILPLLFLFSDLFHDIQPFYNVLLQ